MGSKRAYIPYVLGGLIFLGLGWYLSLTWPWPNLNDDALHERLAPISPSLTLSPKERHQALEIARGALTSPLEAPADPPKELGQRFSLRDKRPLWVTLFLPGHGAINAIGADSSLYRSLRAAARSVKKQALSLSPELSGERLAQLPMQVEFLQGESSFPVSSLPLAYYALEPGVHGLKVSHQGEVIAWSPPSEAIYRGFFTGTHPHRFGHHEALMERVLLDSGTGLGLEEVSITRFSALSLFSPRPGAPLKPVFRGNIPASGMGSEEIRRDLDLGGRWLLAQVEEGGSFKYGYLPTQDAPLEGYNAVRHAGTLFGLFYVGRRLNSPVYLEAGARALPWLRTHLRSPAPEDPRAEGLLCLMEGDTRSTGGAALALLALLEAPEGARVKGDDERELALARYILKMIDARGRVFYGWYHFERSETVQEEPLFYPGESLLALTRLYMKTGDPAHLEGARAIAATQRWDWRLIPTGQMPDHWVIQGLSLLHEVDPEEGWGASALAMARDSLDFQYPFNIPPFPDYFGHYRFPTAIPRATQTGSRTEAIAAAMRLSWSLGEEGRDLEDSVLFASKGIRDQMFRPESSHWLPNPNAALGGIRGGPLDDTLRIDFNQHGLVGLLGGLEASLKREGQPIPWLEGDWTPGDINVE